MCDLNPQETDAIVATLTEINTLTEQINAHTASITATRFMDHAGLAALLATLRDTAGSAEQWVAGKPHEHAGH